MSIRKMTRDELVQYIWDHRHDKIKIDFTDAYGAEEVGLNDWRWRKSARHHAQLINFDRQRVLLITGPNTNNRLGSFVYRFGAIEDEHKKSFQWFQEGISGYLKYCTIYDDAKLFVRGTFEMCKKEAEYGDES